MMRGMALCWYPLIQGFPRTHPLDTHPFMALHDITLDYIRSHEITTLPDVTFHPLHSLMLRHIISCHTTLHYIASHHIAIHYIHYIQYVPEVPDVPDQADQTDDRAGQTDRRMNGGGWGRTDRHTHNTPFSFQISLVLEAFIPWYILFVSVSLCFLGETWH